jgi:hypothetical protein
MHTNMFNRERSVEKATNEMESPALADSMCAVAYTFQVLVGDEAGGK